MASVEPAIRFYNTLGRRIEPFRPAEEGRVRFYTCGPTVYHHAHIGNLRTFVFEDLLRRTLRFLGYEVTQVMNLTDVDDKTIQGARERGESLDAFTAPYIESFFADLDTLRCERAERYPRATRHIAAMIDLIRRLEARGYAYRGDDGSIYFRISKDEDYGRLSGIDPENVRQGERVATDEYDKEDVRDFVLWKAARDGEPSWPSPWGPGRPGWHVECSAMGMAYLGESFDLHCGGVDNIFPHHENEIAQSESATGREFVRTWLHSEHLLVDGKKMSKSLRNQYTLKELITHGAAPRAVRYLFLSVHYRQKLNFTFDSLEAAAAALRRLDEMRFRVEHARESGPPAAALAASIDRLHAAFRAALADDLNVAAALAALFVFVKEVNKLVEGGSLGEGDRGRVEQALGVLDRVLGVLDAAAWDGASEEAGAALDDAAVEALVGERQAARGRRDFAAADRIRDRLQAAGIVIEDTSDGTRWRRR